MMLMMAVLFGTIILLPIYMQKVHGARRRCTTGLLLLPGGLLMGLLAPVVGRLYDRFGARPLLLPGTVVVSAGAVVGDVARRAQPGGADPRCSTCC